MQHIDIRI